MSGKLLIIVAVIWFGAVMAWSQFVPSFGVMLGRGKGAKAVVYIFGYLLQIFIWGWLLPLALGIYRLIKKH